MAYPLQLCITLYHCGLPYTVVAYPIQLWSTLYHRSFSGGKQGTLFVSQKPRCFMVTIILYPLPLHFTFYHCGLPLIVVVYCCGLPRTVVVYPLQFWFTLYCCGLPFTIVIYHCDLPLWFLFTIEVYLLPLWFTIYHCVLPLPLLWFALYNCGLPFTTVFSAEESKAHYVSADSYQVTWWPGDRPQDEINSDSTTDDNLLITSLRPAVTYTVVVEARKMEKYTDMDEAVCKFTCPPSLCEALLCVYCPV